MSGDCQYFTYTAEDGKEYKDFAWCVSPSTSDLEGGAYVQDIPQAITWRRDGRWPLGVLRSQVPRDQGGTVSAATGEDDKAVP